MPHHIEINISRWTFSVRLYETGTRPLLLSNINQAIYHSCSMEKKKFILILYNRFFFLKKFWYLSFQDRLELRLNEKGNTQQNSQWLFSTGCRPLKVDSGSRDHFELTGWVRATTCCNIVFPFSRRRFYNPSSTMKACEMYINLSRVGYILYMLPALTKAAAHSFIFV
jgi:hypothetical protein